MSEFIKPNTQQAFANYERLERIESTIEAVVAQSLVNAEQIETNQRQIEANQQQIANSAENITRLEILSEDTSRRLEERIAEQSRQIQVLADEGRADRQVQREALAAIIAIDDRVEILEQRAS